MVTEITSDHILTPQQLKNHFKVMAGPGAGKTYFLVENIKNIIKTSPRIKKFSKRKLLCITYTNTAVNEIKQRLRDYEGNVEVSTIHGFIIKYIIEPNQCKFRKSLRKQF